MLSYLDLLSLNHKCRKSAKLILELSNISCFHSHILDYIFSLSNAYISIKAAAC